MAKLSTGLRTSMLGTDPLKSLLDGGTLHYYSGTEPATADADLGSAQLLVTFSDGGLGGGLNFGVAADGAIAKDNNQVWQGDPVASGQATFFRYVASGDTGTASTNAPRIQGTVGTGAADIMSDPTVEVGTPKALNFFTVSLPTL